MYCCIQIYLSSWLVHNIDATFFSNTRPEAAVQVNMKLFLLGLEHPHHLMCQIIITTNTKRNHISNQCILLQIITAELHKPPTGQNAIKNALRPDQPPPHYQQPQQQQQQYITTSSTTTRLPVQLNLG
jgi:hypothetical protein